MKFIINRRVRRNFLSRSIRFAALFILCAAFFASFAQAQSENGSSSLEGTVRDQNGAVIQGATVIVKNSGTNSERIAVTDANGSFTVNVLPVGVYDITTKAAGFAEMPVQVTLKVGETTPVALVLAPQGANVLVEVNADAQKIDTETQSTGTVISPRLVEDLPVRGRNFTEFVQLTPAVVQESDRNGLVIAGQRSINSNVAIDGADFNDALQGNQRGGNESVFFLSANRRPRISSRAFGRKCRSRTHECRFRQRRHQIGNKRYSRRSVLF